MKPLSLHSHPDADIYRKGQVSAFSQLHVHKNDADGRPDAKLSAPLLPLPSYLSQERNQLQLTLTHRPAVQPSFAGTFFHFLPALEFYRQDVRSV
jgi:hypothetical protein